MFPLTEGDLWCCGSFEGQHYEFEFGLLDGDWCVIFVLVDRNYSWMGLRLGFPEIISWLTSEVLGPSSVANGFVAEGIVMAYPQ